MWLFLLVAALVAFFLHRVILRPLWYWRNESIKYHIPALPLVGNYKEQALRKSSFTENLFNMYNYFPEARYVGIHLFMTPALLIRDIELIKRIAIKDFDHFTDHRGGGDLEDVDPMMGKNLFFLVGDRWRHMRSALSPSFTTSKMRAMFHLIVECAHEFVSHFEAIEKMEHQVEMKDLFTRYTNDVIANCAFGHKCNSLKDPENTFYMMGKEATTFTGWRRIRFLVFFMSPTILKYLNLPILPRAVTKFFQRTVSESIRYRDENNLVRPDMIHLLMEARKGAVQKEDINLEDTGFATVQEASITTTSKENFELSDVDIAAQALIFFFAGFDTSSTLMSFLAYELALNVDIQEKLQAEIRDMDDELNGGKITYEGLAKMKYLDMVISECLRKWTPGVQSDRLCVKDYVIEPVSPHEKPHTVKKGSLIIFPNLGLHYDEKYFSNPQKFDPERFSDANKANILPYSYIPFGIGPRNCIGSRFALLEVKVLIYHILLKFNFTVIEKTQVPVKLDPGNVNLAMQGGWWLGMKPIKK